MAHTSSLFNEHVIKWFGIYIGKQG